MTARQAKAGQVVTRFAPSPTGRLHPGHAWSAIRAHDLAVETGGRFLLRIEDIDGTRSRPGHVAGIAEDLGWLGLAWEGPVFQSQRLALYAAALDALKALGLVYPCFCTRAAIASLSAPHGPAPAYPGTCRRLSPAEAAARMAEAHCWRLDMAKALASLPPCSPAKAGAQSGDISASREPFPGGPRPSPGNSSECMRPSLHWYEATRGRIAADPLAQGDVILARKDAPASYHLAVTVDDAAQGVTDVVRGTDLFDATHIHRLLQALLGLPTPRYHHHPLLLGADGARLAKRHGSVALADLRAGGMDGPALAAALRAGRLPTGFSVASA